MSLCLTYGVLLSYYAFSGGRRQGRAGYNYAFSGGRRCRGEPRRMRRPTRRIPSHRPRNHVHPQAHLPCLLRWEKVSRRAATDEAFCPSVEVLQKAMRCSSSTASRSPFSSRRRQRRAKVDIIDGRSAGRKAFGSSGAPTPTGGRAEVGIANGRSVGERAGVQLCLLRWEKAKGALTEGGRERDAHSSSTAPRSPFSGRRRQEQVGYKYAFSGGRRCQPKDDG